MSNQLTAILFAVFLFTISILAKDIHQAAHIINAIDSLAKASSTTPCHIEYALTSFFCAVKSTMGAASIGLLEAWATKNCGFTVGALNCSSVEFVPSGHFYSSFPSFDDEARYLMWINDGISDSSGSGQSIPGVDLNELQQLSLFQERLSKFLLPAGLASGGRRRYSEDNGQFGGQDATVYHAMLNHFRPRLVIEIGSGHSSCLLLDVAQTLRSNKSKINFHCIEPFPERLLRATNAHPSRIAGVFESNGVLFNLTKDIVQNADPDMFTALGKNDILFVDSSHVYKYGSDVMYLFERVFPLLRSGVLIHIHDIFWPFAYPKQWLHGRRFWNEAMILRQFLTFNAEFEIILWMPFLCRRHFDEIVESWPIFRDGTGGSIWLRRK